MRSMATPLSALDATFLELEDGDHSAHMHIGGILVFDGPPPGSRSCARGWRSGSPRCPATGSG